MKPTKSADQFMKTHRSHILDDATIGCLAGPISILAMFLIATPLVYFGSVQESNAYNRLTGANTTWWDAVWLELRVSDQPKH